MSQNKSGRPLTTIAVILTCWMLGRVAIIANDTRNASARAVPAPPERITRPIASLFQGAEQWLISRADAKPSALVGAKNIAPPVQRSMLFVAPLPTFRRPVFPSDHPASAPRVSPVSLTTSLRSPVVLSPAAQPKSVALQRSAPPIAPAQFPKPVAAGNKNHLSLSTWMLWRPNLRQNTPASALQLGGSQIGGRLTQQVASIAPATLNGYARFVMPMGQSTNKEAALGVSLKLGKTMPLEVAAERRVAISRGGRNAWAMVVSTGVSDVALDKAISANIYAQAGVVGLNTRAKFIDGEASVMRALPDVIRAPAQIGVVVAGSAQSGINRLDIGPIFTLRPKLGGKAVRASVSWRVRALGNASPRTGLAISIGGDF